GRNGDLESEKELVAGVPRDGRAGGDVTHLACGSPYIRQVEVALGAVVPMNDLKDLLAGRAVVLCICLAYRHLPVVAVATQDGCGVSGHVARHQQVEIAARGGARQHELSPHDHLLADEHAL